MPSPQDILAIETDQIADFIQRHASAKTLSPIIKRLNADLMAGDKIAARALEHLGFPEYA